MRIALLSPWFSTLAGRYAEALRDLGHEALIITTDGHFEPVRDEPSLVISARLRGRQATQQLRRAQRALHAFKPDHVLLDETWDPRFHWLARSYRHVLVVHDAVPHDPLNRPSWQRLVLSKGRARARRCFVFSDHVARQLEGTMPRCRFAVVPLTSEMPEKMAVAARATRRGRSDFIVAGRLGAYKNATGILDAWNQYRVSDAYAGDELIFLGAGDVPSLPVAARHIPGRYKFDQAAELIASAKGVLCTYARASQSGVQLLAMQCATAPLVTAVGGLPEYQPSQPVPIKSNDTNSIVRGLQLLTDGNAAHRLGEAARSFYDERFRSDVGATRIVAALEDGRSCYRS